MNQGEKAELITPPSTLQSKVSVGGPGAVDAETLKRAEQAIVELADDYMKWAAEDLKSLQNAFDQLKAATDGRKEHISRTFQIVHDMKGQGGSFGYDLVTIIGDRLCSFLEGREDVGPAEIAAIQLHVESLQVVLSQKIKGEGGEIGDKLLSGLEQVVQKVTD